MYLFTNSNITIMVKIMDREFEFSVHIFELAMSYFFFLSLSPIPLQKRMIFGSISITASIAAVGIVPRTCPLYFMTCSVVGMTFTILQLPTFL